MSEQSAWMCPDLGSIWPEDGIHVTTFRFAVQVHPITLMPTREYLVVEWPYRTTVALHDTLGWQVIELCEKLFTMDERAATYHWQLFQDC